MRRVAGAATVVAVSLGAGALLGACLSAPMRHHAPRPNARAEPRSEPEPAPAAAAAPLVPDPWSDSGRVPVRIAALEGRNEIAVERAPGAVWRVTRLGDEVVDASGRRGAYLAIEPEGGVAGVRAEGRLYAGPLVVEIRRDGGLRAHAWLDLEEYVAGVVAAEIALWNAPRALLEAQAIAARSYAVANLDGRAAGGARPFLHDGVLDQAFRGRYEPDAAARARGVEEELRRAIAATRGQVLEHGGRVLDARYHASCGGRTAAFADVFSERDPGAMPSVACSVCAAAPTAWSHTFSASDLVALARARKLGERIVSLESARTDAHARWLEVRLVGDAGEVRLPVSELRRSLGWQNWRSGVVRRTWPADGRPVGGLFVEGVGHGHGVGLCQTGARGMAAAGRSTHQILAAYYPGARLGRLGSG